MFALLSYFSDDQYHFLFLTHFVKQENPEPTRCLGVFGMGLYTTETELQHVFAKYGPLEKVQVVKDAKVTRLHFLLIFLFF